MSRVRKAARRRNQFDAGVAFAMKTVEEPCYIYQPKFYVNAEILYRVADGTPHFQLGVIHGLALLD